MIHNKDNLTRSKIGTICQMLCRLFAVVILISLVVIFVTQILLGRNNDGAVVMTPSPEYVERMKQRASGGDQDAAKELFWSLYYEDDLPYEEILYWGGLASQLGDKDLAGKLSCQENGLRHCVPK